MTGKIRWTGPVADMDSCGDPYVEQFITGSRRGPDRGGAVRRPGGPRAARVGGRGAGRGPLAA
jgi:hypothetical protein